MENLVIKFLDIIVDFRQRVKNLYMDENVSGLKQIIEDGISKYIISKEEGDVMLNFYNMRNIIALGDYKAVVINEDIIVRLTAIVNKIYVGFNI